MRVKHRFTFLKEKKTNEIAIYLDKKNIRYTLSNGIPLITFNIFEDDELWSEVNALMVKHKEEFSLIETLYSKEEFENASWLTVRSKWRWEYPQPEDDFEYKHLTYDSRNYCDKCGCGLIQKESFKLKKSPNWGKRNFLMLNWLEDELFINSKVEEVLKNYNLKEIELYIVKNVKTNQQIDNIKQIYVKNILKPGLVNQNNTIKSITKCGKCGYIKMLGTGRGVIFNKEVFRDVKSDIIKSHEVFGDGHMCSRIIFVSKIFYNVIKENGLDKDLVFEPVMLI